MTATAPPADGTPLSDGEGGAQASRGDRGRAVVRGVGELLMTAGVVLLLFVVYQLFWTNVQSAQEEQRLTQGLEQTWQAPPKDKPAPGDPTVAPPVGEAFGFIWIPRLGADFRKPIVEGVGLPQLAEGIGHYPGTAMPGQVGNFAVAGHRATHGEPFRNLDQVRPGDDVVVETVASYWTYRVDSTEIVLPTKVSVLLPVPNQPEARPTQSLITLTTCNPRWASYQRLIVYGHLVAKQPRAAGLPPALAGASGKG